MLLPSQVANLVQGRWNSAELLAALPANQNRVFAGRVGQFDVVFRATPDHHRTRPLIENELEWMQHLRQQGIRAPGVIASQNSRQIETIESDGEIHHVVAFERMPGRSLAQSGELSEQVAERWGRLLGRMNRIATDFRPNAPFRWDGDRTGVTALGQYAGALAENPLPILDTALDAIERMDRTPEFYGVIHGDLHNGNVFLSGNDLYPFDFDECCYHWRMFEVAHVLYCLYFDFVQGGNDLDVLSRLGKALLAGYVAEFPMMASSIPELHHFLIYRLGLLVVWTRNQQPTPRWMALSDDTWRLYLRDWSLDEIKSGRIVDVFCAHP